MDGTFRPVVDPELPPAERAVLQSHPEALTPASQAAPAKPALGGRTLRDAFRSVGFGAVLAYLPLVLLFAGNGWAAAVGLALQTGLVAAWFGGTWLFLTVGVALHTLITVSAFVISAEENPRRLGSKHHGRYYLVDDFDEKTRDYVERAREAIATVMDSGIGEAGLLDDVANTAILPREEWEIARTGAELTRIERRIDKVRSENATLTELIRTQRRAVEKSAEMVEQRVTALERYADRTKAADAVYRAGAAIEEIEADVRELLVRTAQDDLAADAIERDSVSAELRRSVEAAKQAGLALAQGEAEPV